MNPRLPTLCFGKPDRDRHLFFRRGSDMTALNKSALDTSVTRPPLPPFTRETAIQKVRLRKTAGTRAILTRSLWRTRSTRAGGTARNFPLEETRLWIS